MQRKKATTLSKLNIIDDPQTFFANIFFCDKVNQVLFTLLPKQHIYPLHAFKYMKTVLKVTVYIENAMTHSYSARCQLTR